MCRAVRPIPCGEGYWKRFHSACCYAAAYQGGSVVRSTLNSRRGLTRTVAATMNDRRRVLLSCTENRHSSQFAAQPHLSLTPITDRSSGTLKLSTVAASSPPLAEPWAAKMAVGMGTATAVSRVSQTVGDAASVLLSIDHREKRPPARGRRGSLSQNARSRSRSSMKNCSNRPRTPRHHFPGCVDAS
jgi:hypothetical protein